MRKQPSFWSILWTDKASYPIVTGGAMIFLMALAAKLTGTMPGRRGGPDIPVDPEAANLMLGCAVVLIVFLSSIVAQRVARIRGLFDGGHEVEANLRKVKHCRAGTTLKLEFELNGTPYNVRFAFQRWLRTPDFKEGTRIPVLVDLAHPKRVVPLALYGDPSIAQSGERPISADHSR